MVYFLLPQEGDTRVQVVQFDVVHDVERRGPQQDRGKDGPAVLGLSFVVLDVTNATSRL